MRRYKLSELQTELRAKGIPALAQRLKKESGYDARARKLRRNPGEIKAADDARRPE